MTPVKTPAQKQKCIEPECKKAPNGFKTNEGLKRHMKKFHEVVLNVMSPMASSARILFSTQAVQETPSVQGNSRGQINFPSVLTEGRHHCGKCEKEFSTRDEVLEHMDTEHDNTITDSAKPNDNPGNDDHSNDESVGELDIVDTDDEEVLVEAMEDHEDEGIAAEIEKRVAAEKIVETFVEMAFREMHPLETTTNPVCHECVCKDENLEKLDKLLSEKDANIEEKSATIRGLMETEKKNKELKKALVTKQKEIANLKFKLQAKEDVQEVQARTVAAEKSNTVQQEVILDLVVKKCKKCKFTAPNMDVLGLHMENDHQYEFPCADCNKKFPFKNQLKMHKREVHEEGSFSCFVCNEKFRTHKQLRHHMQKRCKSNNVPNQIIHKHNEDILKEDEHKCPKCPKITNNQVSLVHHINTTHGAVKDKCDSCGQDFESRESLITHIVEYHTVNGTHVIQRHVCKICNVEVHGAEAKNNHMCRKPQDTCSFCKASFFSQEAKREHMCGEHPFKSVEDQLLARRRKATECRNGVECYRASRGRCWFKHSQPVKMVPQGVQGRQQEPERQQGQGLQLGPGWQQGPRRDQQQGPWQDHQQGPRQDQQQGQWRVQGRQGQRQGQGQGNTRKQELYCRYQETCYNAQACRFKHFNQGFLQTAQGQNNQ